MNILLHKTTRAFLKGRGETSNGQRRRLASPRHPLVDDSWPFWWPDEWKKECRSKPKDFVCKQNANISVDVCLFVSLFFFQNYALYCFCC